MYSLNAFRVLFVFYFIIIYLQGDNTNNKNVYLKTTVQNDDLCKPANVEKLQSHWVLRDLRIQPNLHIRHVATFFETNQRIETII